MNVRKALERVLLQVQKPARYTGGELGSVVKDAASVDVRFAFCFPDLYEVGMSHLGMKILYSLMNARDDIWCERVFAPGDDFERVMREHQIPLFGLESLDAIADFDMIGFTLQYELSFTAILNMLDLAGLKVRSKDRPGLAPLVVAGGPCACNPEPIADFIDLFILGEGEQVNLELIDLYKACKRGGASKEAFLRRAAQIEGIYVPSLYDVTASSAIWTAFFTRRRSWFRLRRPSMTARWSRCCADVSAGAGSARPDSFTGHFGRSAAKRSTKTRAPCAIVPGTTRYPSQAFRQAIIRRLSRF